MLKEGIYNKTYKEEDMKSILKIILVIIGTIIGAGFASGQEIYLFFNKYGNLGILGMLISCFITAFVIYKVFKIIKYKNIHTYSEFLATISSNKKINKIMHIMIQAFLLVSFYIMVAGFAAYFNQEFNILIYIPAIIMAILCYITFINDTKGIVWINTILIPFLCVFIFYLGIKNFNFTINYFENIFSNNYYWGWLFSSILYASYNSILLIPILIELGSYINTENNNKKEIINIQNKNSAKNNILINKTKNNFEQSTKIISIWCGVILVVLGLILFFLLASGMSYINTLELPLIEITKQFSGVHSTIYGVIILIAIFTTAISSGYGFLKNLPKSKYKVATAIICISSIFVVPIGFSKLVSLLYPIFGVLGLVQIWGILVSTEKKI